MRRFKAILSTVMAAALILACFSGGAFAQETQSGMIVNCMTGVNVRSGPGTGYAKIGTAPKGAVYAVTGKSGSYYEIDYGGKTGYVYVDYISVADTGIGQIVNCNTAVNVRSGPGTGYAKLGTAPKGAVYTVTGKSGSYYAIDFGGRTGYVYSAYISLTNNTPAPAPSAPSGSIGTGRIVNCTIGVNVRSGPGTKYAKIGTAPKDAVYPVNGKLGSYYEIDFGGRVGYVYDAYLSVSAMPPATTPTPSPTPPETPGGEADRIIAGYYASWAAYSGYTPDKIPACVTHVLYAFANIGTDLKIKVGDPDVDPANFEKLRQLKQQRPELKTLISVGGWTWSGKFSDAALTDASREAFANSVVAFVVRYGFDGVDIDWEFPTGGGMAGNVERSQDKTNFTLLMAKLREKLDAQGALDGRRYLLSFAGGAQSFYTNIELDRLGNLVDFATIMTYDMHGPSTSSVTDLNAPLYTPKESSPQYQWSCDAAVALWSGRGFPKAKILMGIPFYGIRFSGVKNAGRGLYQTFASGSSIPYDKIVSTYLGNRAYVRYEHPDALVPWLFDGSTFISYDDAASIAAKAAYIRDRGLGGAAVWELSQNADGTLLSVIDDGLNAGR